MLSIFSCTCWSSVYVLWRNVCLGLLTIFQLGCIFVVEIHELLYVLEIEPLLVTLANGHSWSLDVIVNSPNLSVCI